MSHTQEIVVFMTMRNVLRARICRKLPPDARLLHLARLEAASELDGIVAEARHFRQIDVELIRALYVGGVAINDNQEGITARHPFVDDGGPAALVIVIALAFSAQTLISGVQDGVKGRGLCGEEVATR